MNDSQGSDTVRERLDALAEYGILDTPAEAGFDDVVMLASHICATPIALVSLVERDRQWFKARVGLEACETPIGQSVCALALAGSEVFEIEDLAEDQRTASNPLVTEDPKIRFYAGAPLVSAGGVPIGAVCVIDTEPRAGGLKDEQKRMLQALARQVMEQLELRKALTTRTDSVKRSLKIGSAATARAEASDAENLTLRDTISHSVSAQEAGRIGTFEIDLATNRMTVSAEFCRVFGIPVATHYAASDLEELVIRADAGLRSNQVSRADASATLNVEYRVQRPNDGSLRWVSRRADFVRDEVGKPIRMFGVVEDITEARNLRLHQSVLLKLGDILRDTTSVEAACLASARILAETLGATRSGYGIVDDIDETVVMQPDWNAPGTNSISGLHHFRDYGSFIEDLRRGEIVVIDDVTKDDRTKAAADALIGLGIRVLINVPVLQAQRFVGVAFVHYDEPHKLTDDELDFIRSVADRTRIAVSYLREIEQRVLLNHELSHRLKNTLAMVQAIAAQTLKNVPDRTPVESFEKRLHALSKAHDVLLKQNWAAARIKDVVRGVIDVLGELQRVDLSGPNVELGPRTTLSISLLLHELATNAMKYGALSVDGGRVRLSWGYETGEDDTDFVVRWEETGGPAATKPTRRGFGSRLISLGLVGAGGVALDYAQSGLSATMRAHLEQMQKS